MKEACSILFGLLTLTPPQSLHNTAYCCLVTSLTEWKFSYYSGQVLVLGHVKALTIDGASSRKVPVYF